MALLRRPGSDPKRLSQVAIRDLFESEEHVGQINKRHYRIDGDYEDDIRYCGLVAREMRRFEYDTEE